MSALRVLRLIRDSGPASRPDLQQHLGLSFTAVSVAVAQLLDRGLIVSAGSVKSAAGRKPELFRFNSAKGHVVGVDIGGKRIRVAVADLGAGVIQKVEMPTLAYEGGPRVMERLVALVRGVLGSNGINPGNLLAIGVAAPGISEEKTEVNLLSPFIPAWEGVPVRSTLEKGFGAPVFMENDVDMAVIGERSWGAGRGCDNLVFVNVGVGLAAGIILDGRLYRGARRAAGEIGFMVVDRAFIRESFSPEGALEGAISGPGIVRRFARLGGKGGPGSGSCDGADLGLANLQFSDSEAVFALAEKGDAVAQRVVDETVTFLAIALSNLIAVVNPEKIVLGGGVGLALHSRAGEKLVRFVANHVPMPPDVVPAELGSDASVLGAVTVALEKAHERLEQSLLASGGQDGGRGRQEPPGRGGAGGHGCH